MPGPRRLPELDRRRFLRLTGGGALALGMAATATGPATGTATRPAWSDPRVPADPFTLGVASGDPTPDGVVLWTRLAPDPLALDGRGGMPDRTVPVSWQVAEDAGFRRVVAAGAERTTPALAHSVHAEVRGLRPDRVYWYRFRAGAELSPVGRTRTAPLSGARLNSFSFAFASCQALSNGLFTSYDHLAREDLDAVVFLGDYIYEGPGSAERPHAPYKTVQTLADYRVRHAQYKQEEPLRKAHAAFPWIVTMDDHEVRNNWWDSDATADLALRTNAFQAFWEHMPLRRSSLPTGPDLQLFRRLAFGDLATFNVLDTRQYRHQPIKDCSLDERTGEGYCPGQLDPARSILGDRQERWLLDGLGASATGWNILANQMFFTQRDRDMDPHPQHRAFNLDGWDGYVADRQTILDGVRERGVDNLVVITGDSHQSWVLNTPPTYRDWGADVRPVATEFMVTSVTSGGERRLNQVYDPEPENTPHLLYRDNSHGYARVRLTPDSWRTDYRAVSTISLPDSDIRTISSWAVESGNPGAQRA